MAAPLRKSTQQFAIHEIPLECDIYDTSDYPADSPVFLFFHSGGLAGGARSVVPPWLVQVCYKRKWPLVSASYRLLPQVDGKCLLDDARAAYQFASIFGAGTPSERPVIAGGASAGFFLATLIAHHLTPKPVALLSITGIPTFRHPFFNSSVLIPPDPIPEADVFRYLTEPVSTGQSPGSSDAVFDLDRLLPDGTKNPDFDAKTKINMSDYPQDPNRGILYDYWLYENQFVHLVGDADPGFDWTRDEAEKLKLSEWPITIFIQGDGDEDVREDVCRDVARQLGIKAIYCQARGQGHLFERTKYLEDVITVDPQGGDAMDAVRKAVAELDNAWETELAMSRS
ncbi:Alpha/Beta hydrolase protein [Apodospora peruviana]|uniref:Alpha/Beta hydrolase protein n=1 Tax=Apodospora peruviana TaxID=516989 RepID=A0AAE0HSH2_9PEZI|nr:Alpha/Beta hydrolase protein [Apodospora peruviana]